jgi:hypothetical protein
MFRTIDGLRIRYALVDPGHMVWEEAPLEYAAASAWSAVGRQWSVSGSVVSCN